MRFTLAQQLRDGFCSPLLHVLSLLGHPSLQITEQDRSPISGKGTSMDAHAAGATRPTTHPPQLSVIPAKPLPASPPQASPAGGRDGGGGLPADSGPDKTIGAAGPESVMRNCVCCEFVILPVGSLQGLPWVGGQQPLAHSPWHPGLLHPNPPLCLFLIGDTRGRTGLKGQQN